MAQKIDARDLAKVLDKEFEEYVDLTTSDVKEIVKKVSEDVKEKIKENAPVDTGAYKKSWTVTKTSEGSMSLTMTVHSKGKYRLTHLLENGHALKKGGRTRAFPHIKQGEELAETELKAEVERSLK